MKSANLCASIFLSSVVLCGAFVHHSLSVTLHKKSKHIELIPAQERRLRRATFEVYSVATSSSEIKFTKVAKPQPRPVSILIKYSGGSGLKAIYEATAAKMKQHFPDAQIEKNVLHITSTKEEGKFEIYVDGKLIIQKQRDKTGVYLRMEQLEQAVLRARRAARPVKNKRLRLDAETYNMEVSKRYNRLKAVILEKRHQEAIEQHQRRYVRGEGDENGGSGIGFDSRRNDEEDS